MPQDMSYTEAIIQQLGDLESKLLKAEHTLDDMVAKLDRLRNENARLEDELLKEHAEKIKYGCYRCRDELRKF